jgi:signal transduction histidine kinase
MSFFSRLTLAKRLMWAAIISSTLIFVIAGLVLSTLYVRSAERALDGRIGLYVQGLITEISDNSDGEDAQVDTYGETKFEVYLSGWYWQIDRLDEGNQYRLMSKSLGGKAWGELNDAPRPTHLREGFYTTGPDGKRIRLLERFWDQADDGRYRVRVGVDVTELEADILSFTIALWTSFCALALALVGVVIAQVRFGLRPLHELQTAIGHVRNNKTTQIEGDYPPDLSPLAHELNLLITSNRAILERARTQSGNLAHALKTPLSILVNAASHEQGALAACVKEQAEAMKAQITTSLNRARAAATGDSLSVPLGTHTDVHEVVTRLLGMFAKVYFDRKLMFENHVLPGSRVRMDQEDLEEVLANLIDNACKWTKTRVSVHMHRDERHQASLCCIMIEDDGPGLTHAQCEKALQRGQRLDTQQPGSGLGLSIVTELVQLYAGSLTFETISSGGLRANVHVSGA